jgi:fucose 4-O-acetylase-like acetyltransferase
MKTRNTTIDIVKGIGIIFVVLGHNWSASQGSAELFRVIFSFHIPLFLFVTGVVIKETNQIKDFMKRRADALLKPYLIVLILLGVLGLFKQESSLTNNIPSLVIFLGALYGTGKTIPWVWGPLWYLPHLYITSLISIAILKTTRDMNQRRSWLFVIALTCLALGVHFITTFWKPLPGLPFSLDIALVSISYILLAKRIPLQLATGFHALAKSDP